MEALTLTDLPPVVQRASHSLNVAWQRYSTVQERKEQCKLLIQRCQELLLELSQKVKRGTNILGDKHVQVLEKACTSVEDAVLKIGGKSFAWRLLHQDHVTQAVFEAEFAVMAVLSKFNASAHLSAQRFQTEIAGARKVDHAELVVHLQALAVNEYKMLQALQSDGRESRRLEELIIALKKHVRNTNPTGADKNDPVEAFIRAAAKTVQRVLGDSTQELQHWSVTSLEVTFDRDDEKSRIGFGGFGHIYRGEWHGQLVAVKEMYLEDARALNRNELLPISREISIWSRLAYPHITPFYGACLEATRPFMVTRLCVNGNALEFIRAHPEADRVCILYEVTLGMTYLHNQGIVHGDLKSTNILIGDDGKALLTDFGLSYFQDQLRSKATHTQNIQSNRSSSSFGTLRWMAPEVLDGQPPRKTSDVYSFGITSWELFSGNIPFTDVPDRALARKVVDHRERPERPAAISDMIWGLIQQCWSADPAVRPPFRTVQIRLKPFISHQNAVYVTPPVVDGSLDLSDGFARFQLGEGQENAVEVDIPVMTTSPHSFNSPTSPPISPPPISPPNSLPASPPTSPLLTPSVSFQISPRRQASDETSVWSSTTSTLTSSRVTSHRPGSAVSSEKSLARTSNNSLGSVLDLKAGVSPLSFERPPARRKYTGDRPRVSEVNTSEHVLQQLSVFEHWVSAAPRQMDNTTYFSTMPNLMLIQDFLLENGHTEAKENILFILITLSQTETGRIALQAQPKLLSVLVKLLSNEASISIKASKCLASLVLEDANPLLSQGDFIPSLAEVLWKRTNDEKAAVAACLCNVTVPIDGITAALSHPRLLQGLASNLLSDIPETLRQPFTEILANIAKTNDGADAILALAGLLDSLIKLLSPVSSTYTREQVAKCFRRLASYDNTQKIAVVHDGFMGCLKRSFADALHYDNAEDRPSPAKVHEEVMRCLTSLSNYEVNHFVIITEDKLVSDIAEVARSKRYVKTFVAEYASLFFVNLTSSVVGRKYLRNKRKVLGALKYLKKHGEERTAYNAKLSRKNVKTVTALFRPPPQ